MTAAPLPEPGPELAWMNRAVLAERLDWPEGALEVCERIERQYPRWSVSWREANTVRGFERPAGFYGVDRDYKGWDPRPAYGATGSELAAAIARRNF